MATAKKQVTSRKPADQVTAYAKSVVSGKTIAGPHVRDACARHLRDLEHGPARGLKWDLQAAQRAIGFYADVLCLNGGDFEGVPYELLDWQAFIIGSIFGWKGADGYRRFRVAYVETAKGSGKSPLAAGVGLYGLVADGEQRAEVYAAATKKDQAMILFRDAVAMVDLSPILSDNIVRSGSKGKEWNLAYHSSHSFFRAIASDDSQSGPRPHISLLDEIHEHANATMVEMLRAGTKGRKQALIFMITNSGTNKRSVCWEYHEYGAKISAGTLIDDSFFSYICALDETDDPFKNEKCWPKANPSLGVTIQKKYLREQVTQARNMPAKESVVRRLNFCQWVEASSPWISGIIWMGAIDRTEIDLRNRRCWGGLDLSSTKDLTAFSLVFEPVESDPVWRLKTWFWTPAEGISDKQDTDKVPYVTWEKEGHIFTSPGNAISKLHVIRELVNICSQLDVQDIAYDRWRIEDLKQLMEDEGITLPTLEPFGQGFKDMSPALDEFETRLLNNVLKHEGNPCMNWNAANAVIEQDPAENRKVSKVKSSGRIDGIVSAIMATGRSTAQQEAKQNIDDFLRDPICG
jgi:phage terminase large subunit-like protein